MADLADSINSAITGGEKKEYSPWTRSKQQPALIAIFIVIILVYLIFFLSPMFVKKTTKDEDIELSEIGTQMTSSNGRALTIDTWSYCPAENAMEVKLLINNTTYDGVEKYVFTSATDANNDDSIQVAQIVADHDFIVLRISNLPAKWTFCALRMYMPNADTSDTDNAIFELYTSRDNVDKVKSMPQKTANQYRAEYIQESIDGLNEQLKSLQNRLESDYAALDGYDKSEASIEREMPMATEDKQQTLQEQLKEIESNRKGTNADIANTKEAISDKKQQIADYKTVRDTYLGKVPSGVKPN